LPLSLARSTATNNSSPRRSPIINNPTTPRLHHTVETINSSTTIDGLLFPATTGATPPATGHRTPQQQQQDLQNRQEKSKLAQHFSTPGASRELVIEGVRFSMKEDGSKLIRVTGEPRNGHAIFGRGKSLNHIEPSATSPRTPKKAVVAGVEFFRTKNGNLLRSATINVASKYATSASKRGTNTTNCVTGRRASQPRNASTSSRTVFHRDHTIQPSRTDWPNLPDRVICW
jgi:hypothetical protein